MATTTSVTTTYAGEFAGKYINAAFKSADTLGNDWITFKPNIKYKSVVKSVASSDLIKDASCAFTATGTITLTERILAPKELQVNVELCKDDFQSDWEALQMGYSAHDNMPPIFSEYFIGNLIGSVGAGTETSIWHGDEDNTGEFDGFVTLATADASVADVASTASGGVTASNVIAELTKLIKTIPVTILTKEDLTIYVAPNVARDYGLAMAALGYNMEYYDGSKPMNFNGIKMVACPGLTASYMLAAQKSNLWFGTGLLNDHNEVKLLDMAELDGSQNVRFVMRYTAGVQYGVSAEVVLYTPSS